MSLRYRTSADIINGLRGGEHSAAVEFTRRVRPPMLRAALTLGADRSDAAELVDATLSEVMLRLIRRGPDGMDNLEGYAVVAIRNRLLNQRRGLRRRGAPTPIDLRSARRELDAAALEVFVHDEAGQNDLEQSPPVRALFRVLRGLIAELTGQDRLLLVCIREQQPVREIAETFSITHSAAKVRVHRLKQRLRTGFLDALSQLAPADAAAIERILRRAGVVRPPATPLHTSQFKPEADVALES